MRHFNIAKYILRRVSLVDAAAPLPFAGCAGAGAGDFFDAGLPGVGTFDLFLPVVTIE
jgi:hypothetical protein